MAAAKERVLIELGRSLASINPTDDLNQTLARQLSAGEASASRYQRAVKRLTGGVSRLPTWPPTLVYDVRAYAENLHPTQRLARNTGNELEAALNDPRWAAAEKA